MLTLFDPVSKIFLLKLGTVQTFNKKNTFCAYNGVGGFNGI
jgi:hypothetical protein